MRLITLNRNLYVIRFQYLPSLVDKVKELPERRWNPELKAWTVPARHKQEVENFASAHRFTLDVPVAEAPVYETDYPEVLLPELTVDIPLKGRMFDFQRSGVAYILQKKKLIVGDQMGLGKTIQAIAAITAAEAFPCLVICPASLKLNWEREWRTWTKHKALILSDNVKRTFKYFYDSGLAKVFIVNYESLKKYFVAEMPKDTKKLTLRDITFNGNKDFFKSVIIDEAHRVKDPKAQQTKFTRAIADKKEWVLALTGTPVVNKPADLASQLAIIGRLGDFGGWKHFMDRYENPGKPALLELQYKLKSNCFYRRDKSEATDLPPKTRQVVMCDITTRKEYTDALADLADYLKKYRQATDDQVARSMRGEVMVRIGILKNISARGKLEACYEWIRDTLDNGEKLILFGHLREVLGAIKKKFPAVSITGEDSITERQNAIDRFQNDPGVNLIVCSIAAAGVGITLTASSTVGFIEMGWHPAIMEQAEDRAHRIGQKDHVNCIYFIGRDTIDEWVYKLIDEKRNMSNLVTGAKDDVEESIMDSIIELFNQKYNIN
jgi:SWI/SNF-related matrix-associated actin-dependent regulator 1 of chromatin subfamily A